MKPAQLTLVGIAGLSAALLAAACSGTETPSDKNTAGGSSGTGTGGTPPAKGGTSGTTGTAGGSAGTGNMPMGGSAGTGVGGAAGATGAAGGTPPVGGTGPTGGGGMSGGTAGVTGNAGLGPSGGVGGDAGGGPAGSGQGGSGGSVTGLHVQLDKTFQTIQGFGINTALMPSGKTFPADKLFGTTGADAIGLSILRIGMNTDGTLTGQFISEAKAAGATKIIGSCWSAPANCKSNNNVTMGGSLLESCYDSWATTIANFAKNQGLYAMSIANESDFASCASKGPPCTTDYETMTYTAKQMVAWVKVAGAKIKSVAPTVKVIAPEASEWIHAWSTLSATGSTVSSHPQSSDPHACGCYSNDPNDMTEAAKCAQKCKDGDGYDYGHWLNKDAAAWAAFDIFGVHEYDSQIAFPWPADVNGGVKDKEIWQTEMSGVHYWPEEGPSTDINNGVAVAGWIHSALTVGEASAWLWWWYQAYYEDDNEGLALTKSGTTNAKRYYTLGNYSKFVRPGYIAVQVAGNDSADVLLSAYKSPDSATVVVVAVNKGAAAASPMIAFAGGTAPASCTPTVTSAMDNLKDGAAVTVTGGVLAATLASKTVTTYVCK